MKLSIIIINWNTKELIKKCLNSVLKYTSFTDYQLIVIDNNSSDGSQKFLSDFCLQNKLNLKIILNNQNKGFAQAVNQGLKIAQGEYILLLNPDTEIKEKTLSEVIDFISLDKSIGILGGKILNPNGSHQPSVRSFPTLSSQIFILLKLHHFFRNKAVKKYLVIDFDYSKTQEVDQVMGAFFLIRRKVIEQIGYFDDKFFLWFEEVDFCKRAKDTGWKILYCHKIEIIHCGGASFSQKSSFRNQCQFNKSLLYYFKKHHGLLKYYLLLFLLPFNLFLTTIISFLPFLRRFKKDIKIRF